MPKHDPIREMEDSTRKQKKAPERKLTANERTADLNPVSSDLPGGHTGMLSDARLLRSASAVQRAELISGLQRTHGNAYVQRLLIQAKLTVNPPDDKYEQEADQVGEAVANTFNSTAQRQEMPEEEEMLQTRSLQRQEMPEEEELLQGKSLQRQEMPEEEEMLQGKSLQRQEMPEEEEMLQTRSTGNRVPEVTDRLEERINAARDGGEALNESLRTSLEPHFGRDLSDVRVHSNAQADELSHKLEARAFTTGRDIFFRSGEYQPDSSEGRKLLGHEMTHVVQQGGAPLSLKAVQLEKKEANAEKIEAEAELDKAKTDALHSMSRANIQALLHQAARCQQLGADSEGAAKNALDRVANEAIADIKNKTGAFDVMTSSLKVARDILDQLAVVRLAHETNEGKATEKAFTQILYWAQQRLGNAVRDIQLNPSDANAQEGIERTAVVYMLGGDPEAGIKAVQKWSVETARTEEGMDGTE